MDDAAADTICKRAMVELVFLLSHQRNPRSKQRRDWALLRSLVRDALSAGPRAGPLQEGPPGGGPRPPREPGRARLLFVPPVRPGGTPIMMATPQGAGEPGGFL